MWERGSGGAECGGGGGGGGGGPGPAGSVHRTVRATRKL